MPRGITLSGGPWSCHLPPPPPCPSLNPPRPPPRRALLCPLRILPRRRRRRVLHSRRPLVLRVRGNSCLASVHNTAAAADDAVLVAAVVLVPVAVVVLVKIGPVATDRGLGVDSVESVPSPVSQWTVESGLPPSLSPEVCFFVVQEKSIACWGWVSPPRSAIAFVGLWSWTVAFGLGAGDLFILSSKSSSLVIMFPRTVATSLRCRRKTLPPSILRSNTARLSDPMQAGQQVCS